MKEEQKKARELQETARALTQKTKEAEKKLTAVKIAKGGLTKAVKKMEVLLAQLDAAVDECELLGEQWNGLKRYNIFILI